MRCFLCGNQNLDLVYSLSEKDIVRCPNDGLFLAKIKTLDKLYGETYFENSPHPIGSNKKYFENKLTVIKNLTGETKPTVLDVGCGWGDFLEMLESEKIRYLGIDADREAINICKTKGLTCSLATIEELIKNNKQPYSAITLFQVIEHLENPIKLLTSAKKLLKKNGMILITTPNNDTPLRKIFGSRWSVYNEPSHFVFYNKKTLVKTLVKVGLKPVSVKIDDSRKMGFNYILGRLGGPFKHKFFEQISLPTDPYGDLMVIAS